ncbi:DUF3488 and transglutaminase-like domain-containing protein [Actinocatenispora rupis]|uniref:Transglutaminase-like domain-containing protein n=1 Tax=Actinocatenispora rupis TaxID=519421 RepID=A0A8J3JH47_9ACTN|nr:transglutaminase domain-containing protein [Actinocatenispora rupis]GID14808.1 hypothetical protein Aru02nite_56970 [Actinocatenispora rupis]
MVTVTRAEPVTAARGWRMRPVPVGCALLAVAAATLVAGLSVTPIYSGTQLPVLLTGAAVGAVALTVLLRLVRAPAVLAVLGSLVGLVACLVGATAALRDPAAGGLGTVLFDAVRNSGARILTSAIPVQPAPDTVLLPIAATWLAGAIGTVLLGPLRADGAPARRRAAASAVPPVLLLIGALVLVGPNGSPSYVLLAVFVLALALLLAAASRPWSVPAATPAVRRDLGSLRRLAAAVVVLAVLAGAAVTAGPALAGLVHRQPVDPRSYVVPPQKQLDQLNPLGMLAAWALDPKQDLLSVRTDRPERIQWATLSEYDGITWQPDRTYRAAGSVLPEPPTTSDQRTTVRQRVTVAGLRGGWLPAVAAVREVHGVRVGYDSGSGTVLTPDGLSTGLSYQTVSLVPQQDPGALSAATVPAGTSQRYLTVPAGVPDGIVTLAQRTAGTGSPYRKALLLEQLLRTKYQFWSKAPSGNGYVTLRHFLLTKPAAGGARGTSEQFATSFALMARIVGLPTRVVVGFHAGQRTGAGTYRVTSGDAFAWPEVKLAGHGWVAFDPTPAAGKGSTPPDEDTPQAKSQQKQKSQQLDDAAPTPTAKAPTPHSSSGHAAAPTTGSGPDPAVLGGSAAALLLVLAVAAVLLLRRRRTTRRLATGAPADRILGAWAEVRDTLRLAGVRPDDTRSAVEVAALATTGVPDRPGPPLPDLTPLAHAVNAIGFAPSAPRPAVPPEQAAGSGALARDYTRALRSRLGVLKRLWWHLDPRPLFWR